MSVIALSPLDLMLAAGLVLALAACSRALQLNVHGTLLIAAGRTVIQLLLVGLVLKALFAYAAPGWVLLMATIMLLAAGREVIARQKRKLRGPWGYGIGLTAMFISSFAVTVLALTVIVQAEPWYRPQYAIPMLGMLLGNTMNSIALGMNHLTRSVVEQREAIEARLALGHTRDEAVGDIRRESVRTGIIPIMNSMAAAGLVSLPGMMTGQILGGTPPVEAVKYQILIMFLIASGTGFGALAAVHLTARRLFDDRHRLRLEESLRERK
ncbi:ABC transporter permease [Kiritimatiella glycovorans]|uniref:ABC-type uncharacterized transport system, permease component n=1 Tax=Kiritimatiella glycovorans TaxID=1307763 RepID=A0A0G3EFN6_9BACT|nr:iron export ABC transporter permease subunit FetB [Kiritimatiella glycovorans]AKJ65276.1 ABC-type uncharacterized transport system, permease component [Kiritimatiella glycovorans]